MNRLLAATALVASLSACASTYRATPLAAGIQPISHVAIVDDALPEGVSAVEVASVGSNFGLIGALIDAGVRDSREDAIDAALATVSFDAESDLERALTDALSAKAFASRAKVAGLQLT